MPFVFVTGYRTSLFGFGSGFFFVSLSNLPFFFGIFWAARPRSLRAWSAASRKRCTLVGNQYFRGLDSCIGWPDPRYKIEHRQGLKGGRQSRASPIWIDAPDISWYHLRRDILSTRLRVRLSRELVTQPESSPSRSQRRSGQVLRGKDLRPAVLSVPRVFARTAHGHMRGRRPGLCERVARPRGVEGHKDGRGARCHSATGRGPLGSLWICPSPGGRRNAWSAWF